MSKKSRESFKHFLQLDNCLEEMLKMKKTSNAKLHLMFENGDAYTIGEFLLNYDSFTEKNMSIIKAHISKIIFDETSDEMLVSDLLDFAYEKQLHGFEKRCEELIKKSSVNGFSTASALFYLSYQALTFYNFPHYKKLFDNILDDEEFFNDAKLISALFLLRFTGNPFYVQEIKEIISYDEEFLKHLLSNVLKAHFHQKEYFFYYEELIALVK
jgi:hypothetical protein